MPKRVDLTGVKIGRITVERAATSRRTTGGQSKTYWIGKCECGTIKEYSTSALTHRKKYTRSCGCLQIEVIKKQGLSNYKGDGVAGTNSLFTRYKRGAKHRNLTFSLNKEEFELLINSACFYCGDQPKGIWRRNEVKSKKIYNGIDRIDSNKGYFKENCVSCCYICNQSKMDLPLDEFFKMVKKIYEVHFK